MIRSYFGISKNPFAPEALCLLEYQQEIYEILMVHTAQGGLCLLMGEPGTGKSVIKESLKNQRDKRYEFVSVSRSMHTYTNTVKLLCDAFNVEFKGSCFNCERRLIEVAQTLYQTGRSIIIIIDDAHLLDMMTLRKIRLLLEDFPKNHNLILVGQPQLLNHMSLNINLDIKSRVTYSVVLKKIPGEVIERFILEQLDKVGLPHSLFTDDALALILRSADGIIRRAKNICLGTILQAVRERKQNVTLQIVNQVLLQPHWRKEFEIKMV